MVAAKSRRTGRTERRFKNFMWTTRRTWSRPHRIVAKAEWTQGEGRLAAGIRRGCDRGGGSTRERQSRLPDRPGTKPIWVPLTFRCCL
jgi:hypothetical protein